MLSGTCRKRVCRAIVEIRIGGSVVGFVGGVLLAVRVGFVGEVLLASRVGFVG